MLPAAVPVTQTRQITNAYTGADVLEHAAVMCRRAQGYDSGLLDTVKDKVTLYSTTIGDSMPYTTLEAAVAPNQILRESRLGSQLTVWVGSRTGNAIRVHLCRPEADTETDCGDGKDNDCDGYTDKEDTDCKAGPTPSRKLLVEPTPVARSLSSVGTAALEPSPPW
jgi:hypothetical protein